MNPWLNNRNPIRVYYKDQVLSYDCLMKAANNLEGIKINTYGVIICDTENMLDQLLTLYNGLLTKRPVYFGQVADGQTIGREMTGEDIFLVAATSGTTGRKKHIFKRQFQWTETFQAHSEFFDITREDCLFVNGSLAYTANLYSVLHILSLGGSVVLSNEKNPRKWCQQIEDYKCSIGFLVPSKLRLLEKACKDGWSYKLSITTAGEALSQKVLRRLYVLCPKLKIHHYYGAAETGHLSAIRHEELKKRPDSVGRPFPGVFLQIQEGLIYGKTPYGQKRGQDYESAYDYGWIDPAGYLYIKGRKDTQINVNGRKFDAGTVVTGVKALEGIADCLFIPLDSRHLSYGLYILLESVGGEGVQAVEGFIQNQLPRWQWPTTYKIVTNGIYSDKGKYDMVRIRALFSEFLKE